MAYSKEELTNLKSWIYFLAGELEDLQGTDPALMLGIEVGDIENSSGMLPIPGKFALQVKEFLIGLYTKDIQLLTNLTANISKLLLAEELAADYRQINDQLEQWNKAKRKNRLTLKAIFGKKVPEVLPVPVKSISSVISLMITDLTKEKEMIELRIALLADLDSPQPAAVIINELKR